MGVVLEQVRQARGDRVPHRRLRDLVRCAAGPGISICTTRAAPPAAEKARNSASTTWGFGCCVHPPSLNAELWPGRSVAECTYAPERTPPRSSPSSGLRQRSRNRPGCKRFRAGMCVDGVQNHRDTALVALVDQAPQVVRRAIAIVGAIKAERRVAPPLRAFLEVRERHQLDYVHPESSEVVEPPANAVEVAPKFADRGAGGHQFVDLGNPERRISPGECGRTRFQRKRRVSARSPFARELIDLRTRTRPAARCADQLVGESCVTVTPTSLRLIGMDVLLGHV